MCLIITIVLFGFAIQNFLIHNWITAIIQLLIAVGFLLLLINNIKKTRCERNGTCYNGCSITNWIGNLFKRRDRQVENTKR